MFLDRRRRDDLYLEWKVRLFTVAAALFLIGLYLDLRWLTGTAILVLVIAILLRFLPQEESPEEELAAAAGEESGESEQGDEGPEDEVERMEGEILRQGPGDVVDEEGSDRT